jgi:hypothetical protein
MGAHAYENGVTYQDAGNSVVNAEEGLVSGNTIHLRPLVGESVSTSSAGSETVVLTAGETGGTTVDPDDDWTLTLPTRLSETAQWEALLREELDSGTVESVAVSGGEVDITFDSGSYDLRCTPVGLAEEPGNSPNVTPSSPSSESGDAINPVGSGELQLTGTSSKSKDITMTFENKASGEKTVTDVRVPYMNSPGNNKKDMTISGFVSAGSAPCDEKGESTFGAGSGYHDLSSDLTWGPGETCSITADGGGNPNDGFAIIFKFDDGTTSTYFVSGD